MDCSKLDDSEVRLDHVRIPIHRFRLRRLILAPRVRPKKTSSTSTTKKDERLVIAATFPCHEVLMFVNQQLLGAMQVEYQNKTKSPFETHPIHMWTFLTCICFYSVVLAFKTHLKDRSGNFTLILKHLLLVSGSLSSASLLCIFQPRHQIWFLYVIIGIYVPLMLAGHLLKNQVLNNVVGATITSAFKLKQKLKLFCGCLRQ